MPHTGVDVTSSRRTVYGRFRGGQQYQPAHIQIQPGNTQSTNYYCSLLNMRKVRFSAINHRFFPGGKKGEGGGWIPLLFCVGYMALYLVDHVVSADSVV